MTMQGYELAAAMHDSQGPPDEVEPPSDERIREMADGKYAADWQGHVIEIADDAPIERAKGGYWVTARLWVPGEEVD